MQRLQFFGAMALYNTLMLVSQIIVVAGMNRTADGVSAVAAYTVATSVGGLMDGVVYSTRNLVLILGAGEHNFRTAVRITGWLLVPSLLVHALIGFTPLGRLIFARILHVEGAVLAQSLWAYPLLILSSTANAVRGVCHGRLVMWRQPWVLMLGMVLRMALQVVVMVLAVQLHWAQGAAVGTAAMALGIVAEAAVAIVAIRRGPRLGASPGTAPVSTPAAWRLQLPLLGVALAAQLLGPVITMALARLPDPATALAAFTVAGSVGGLLLNALLVLHDLVVVFGREGRAAAGRKELGVCLAAGVGIAALLALLGFTPGGADIIRYICGAGPAIVAGAQGAVRVQVLYAPLLAGLEFAVGLALLGGHTRYMLAGKGAALGGAFIALGLFRSVGPAAGVWAQVGALLGEGGLLLVTLRGRGMPLGGPSAKSA